MAPYDKSPASGIDTADYMMHERLQKLEEVSVQFAAHTAAEEFRFEMISNQIRDLGEKVEGGMKSLREAVELLQEESGRQQKAIEALVADSTKHKERVKFWKKVVFGSVLAVLGGIVQAFGQTIWDWIRSLGK